MKGVILIVSLFHAQITLSPCLAEAATSHATELAANGYHIQFHPQSFWICLPPDDLHKLKSLASRLLPICGICHLQGISFMSLTNQLGTVIPWFIFQPSRARTRVPDHLFKYSQTVIHVFTFTVSDLHLWWAIPVLSAHNSPGVHEAEGYVVCSTNSNTQQLLVPLVDKPYLYFYQGTHSSPCVSQCSRILSDCRTWENVYNLGEVLFLKIFELSPWR